MSKEMDISKFAISQEEAEKMIAESLKRTYGINLTPKQVARGRARKQTERQKFQVKFVAVPIAWHTRLDKARCIHTHNLARRLLIRAFSVRFSGHGKREIVLSAEITGLNSSNRHRAANELKKLGLIKITRGRGRRASRIVLKHLGASARYLVSGE